MCGCEKTEEERTTGKPRLTTAKEKSNMSGIGRGNISRDGECEREEREGGGRREEEDTKRRRVETMEEKVKGLNDSRAHLLKDTRGERRGAFAAMPRSALAVLRDAWGLGEHSPAKDRVSKELDVGAVQSYSPNLRALSLDVYGFPVMGDGSKYFKNSAREYVTAAQLEVEEAISHCLKSIGHQNESQSVSFLLSFVKTYGYGLAQDPHIDYRWEQVTEDVAVPDAATSGTESRSSARRSGRVGQRLPFKERVPFTVFFH